MERITPMTRKLIVGIAGPTAGGKTTVATYIGETYGAFRTKYSDVLIDIAKKSRPPLPLDKASLQELSTRLRRTHGEHFLTEELRKKLAFVTETMVIIEGNRRMVDMQFLTSLSDERDKTCVLMYIDADPAARWSRMNRRLHTEGMKAVRRKEFDTLENDECEAELPLVRQYIAKNGVVIDNTHLSLVELYAKVDQVIQNVLK